MIAYQYFRQLSQNTLDAFFGNAVSTFCFRVSLKDAELLAEYSGWYTGQTYSNLDNGTVVAICLLKGEPQLPVIGPHWLVQFEC